jgi:hypothetical protein
MWNSTTDLYIQPMAESSLSSTSFVYYTAYVDRVIQKKRRDYSDPTSSANMKKLNDDLASIQNIMRKTIDDVLDRGNKLDGTCARNVIHPIKYKRCIVCASNYWLGSPITCYVSHVDQYRKLYLHLPANTTQFNHITPCDTLSYD